MQHDTNVAALASWLPLAGAAESAVRRKPPTQRVLNALADDRADEDVPAHPVHQMFDEEDVVYLHFRLLAELERLAHSSIPLAELLDLVRWVSSKDDGAPFSFARCVEAVARSPHSPISYCGVVDIDDVRSVVLAKARRTLDASLSRYHEVVRDCFSKAPDFFVQELDRNPQFVNEMIKRASEPQQDLFGFPVNPQGAH